jgi:hypothetical protein
VRRRGLIRVVALAAAVVAAACADEPRPRRQDPGSRNPASRGYIDSPAADEIVGSTVTVAGWAADESGVERVRLYADDRLVASVPLSIRRPDVEKAFPSFARPGAIHGWVAGIDFDDKTGYCVIRAEALDGRGALTRFAQVTVRIVP